MTDKSQLPMSFIAAFFAIPLDEFQPTLSLNYASKYICEYDPERWILHNSRSYLLITNTTVSIGLILSILLVILALTVDNINRWWHKARKPSQESGREKNDDDESIKEGEETVMSKTLAPNDVEFLQKHGHNHVHLFRHLLGNTSDHDHVRTHHHYFGIHRQSTLPKAFQGIQKRTNTMSSLRTKRRVRYDLERAE